MARLKKIFDGKNGCYPRGSGKPYGAIGSAGFLRLLRSPFGSLRPRTRHPLALRLDNDQHHRIASNTNRENAEPVADRPIPSFSTVGASADPKRLDKDLRIKVRTPTLRQIAADSPMQRTGGGRNRLTWTPLDTKLGGNN
jgi:hypothetical protein